MNIQALDAVVSRQSLLKPRVLVIGSAYEDNAREIITRLQQNYEDAYHIGWVTSIEQAVRSITVDHPETVAVLIGSHGRTHEDGAGFTYSFSPESVIELTNLCDDKGIKWIKYSFSGHDEEGHFGNLLERR